LSPLNAEIEHKSAARIIALSVNLNLGLPNPVVTLVSFNETEISLKDKSVTERGSTLSLTPAEMDAKMDEHFRFEARDDIDGVLATLSDDVEHDIVGWPLGPTRGRDGARPFYETLFADLSDGRVACVRRLYGQAFMVDESVWSGRAPGRPFGQEGRNRPLEFRLLHVVEFTEGGDIRRENVWVDLAAILQQLPQD
jgi:hypothetical protein